MPFENLLTVRVYFTMEDWSQASLLETKIKASNSCKERCKFHRLIRLLSYKLLMAYYSRHYSI